MSAVRGRLSAEERRAAVLDCACGIFSKGSYRGTTIHAAPVRVKANGRWVPVDLNLRRDPDGTVAAVAHPEGLTLVVEGDASLIRDELVAAGLGEIVDAYV